MAKKSKRPDKSRSLIVRDMDGFIYFVSPERLGAPIIDPALSRKIDAFGTKRTNLNFALLIPDSNELVAMARNAGPRNAGPG